MAEAPVSTAVAVVPVAAQATQDEGNGVEGEISRTDIRLPRLNLVQKVGDLSNLFSPGVFLFNKEVVLSDGKTPINLTVLRLKKMYQQAIPYGTSDEMPLSFNTAAEVVAIGGSLRWGEENYYSEIAHVQVAIAMPADCPEELQPLFPHEVGGEAYGLAMWTLTGSGFTSAGKTLITAASTLLRAGLHTGRFNLTSELKKNAKNSWLAPVIKFAGKHSEADAAFFASLK